MDFFCFGGKHVGFPQPTSYFQSAPKKGASIISERGKQACMHILSRVNMLSILNDDKFRIKPHASGFYTKTLKCGSSLYVIRSAAG